MKNPNTTSRRRKTAFWILQILLASGMAYGGFTKLFTPIDQLAAMWPWAGEVPAYVVRGTGVIDLLAMLGLILPALLNIHPQLTRFAAMGIIVLMISATVFHVSRGEASQITVNIVFMLLAGAIIWLHRKER